jgi:hypothetical protein
MEALDREDHLAGDERTYVNRGQLLNKIQT